MTRTASARVSRAMIGLGAIVLIGVVSADPTFAAPPKDAKPTVTTPAPASVKPAKSRYATSTVRNYTPATRSLTLATGMTYVLDATVKDDGLKTGQKVKVRYVRQGSERRVDHITFIKH